MAKAPQGRYLAIAVSYGVIASGLVFALSYIEGTLFHPKTSVFGDIRAVQYPYVDNISTIVDFAILNPIAVFFVLCAQRGYRTAHTHSGIESLVHRVPAECMIARSPVRGPSLLLAWPQSERTTTSDSPKS